MKTFIIMYAAAISFAACNNDNNSAKGSNAKTTDSTAIQTPAAPINEAKANPLKETLSAYLQIKNGLANENGKDAASGGKALVDAIGKVDKTKFTADQNKTYSDVADDAKEMAEHIGENADKLEHQREHFDMLSNDVYDMVKTFGAGQPLYKDFCPMYNNKKGAFWLSETKEIKNPYLGKKMPACGSVKEELK
ncbi:MAG: DUF3347 domain-containing protein [Chitinophagaceae bacterium]